MNLNSHGSRKFQILPRVSLIKRQQEKSVTICSKNLKIGKVFAKWAVESFVLSSAKFTAMNTIPSAGNALELLLRIAIK